MAIVASRIEKLDSVRSTFRPNLFFLFSAKVATACFNATRCDIRWRNAVCRVLHAENGTHWRNVTRCFVSKCNTQRVKLQ